MLFKFLIAADACEIRLKIETTTWLALVRTHSWVLHMRMLASTRCTPCIYVKSFSPWKPVLTDFFWPPWNKSEGFAIAFLTGSLEFVFQKLLFMIFEVTSTEASWVFTNSEAVFCCRGTSPGYINSALDCFVSMIKLPGHHLFCSGCHTDLLNELEDLSLRLCLHHV